MSASEIAVVNEKLSAAIASGDAAAAAALYTEDGCFLASNMDFLRGRAAIQQFLQGILDMGVKELKLETLELETFGDTAVQVGTYELLAEGGAQADSGKFIVIWKNIDGQWQLHRDMINTNLPAPE